MHKTAKRSLWSPRPGDFAAAPPVVSRQAWWLTLGAFVEDRLVGFVHHLVAVQNGQIAGYSHMMAVAFDYQNKGLGAQLKWAQRERALAERRTFIKWTWEPMRARNAHFNLNRLGAVVEAYAEDFYGTDYSTGQDGLPEGSRGIDSDRLQASWYLDHDRVVDLGRGVTPRSLGQPSQTIVIPADWIALLKADLAQARAELARVRRDSSRRLLPAWSAPDLNASSVSYLLYDSQSSEDRTRSGIASPQLSGLSG